MGRDQKRSDGRGSAPWWHNYSPPRGGGEIIALATTRNAQNSSPAPLRSIKADLDPSDILNPGVLIDCN